MNRGYWKFWRKTEDSHLFEFPLQFTLWCYLLTKASHNHHTYPDGTKIVPGELVTSYGKLAAACGMGVKSVRTNLKHLKNSERIAVQPTHRNTKITVLNWESYQVKGEAAVTVPDQPKTLDRAQTGHGPGTQRATTKNSNSNSHPKEERELPPEARQHAALLRGLILENDEKARVPKDLTAWADTIDKLHRIDGRDWAEIEAVIRWCQDDSFWWKNILSGKKLRKQFTQLRAAERVRPPGKEKWREALESYDA